uniref:Uncharacterized protein n=1 Tax=Glossina pallidipes TaxID=7398 RepID=A0A1B0A592_GLOPL
MFRRNLHGIQAVMINNENNKIFVAHLKEGVFVIDIKIQIQDHNLNKRCNFSECHDRAAVGDRPRDPETLYIPGGWMICPSLSPKVRVVEFGLRPRQLHRTSTNGRQGCIIDLTLEWEWCVTHISWPTAPSQQRASFFDHKEESTTIPNADNQQPPVGCITLDFAAGVIFSVHSRIETARKGDFEKVFLQI